MITQPTDDDREKPDYFEQAEEVRNGGPAFPELTTRRAGDVEATDGMTLRDWFAGQALAGMCTSPANYSTRPCNEVLAEWAYTIADKMIAERNKNI